MTLAEFKARLAQIESSGGKDTNHRTITSGVQEGASAYGTYALMPNTVREMENRKRLAGESYNPNMLKGNDEVIKAQLAADPTLEQDYVNRVLGQILKKTNDPEKAMYMYNMGHNKNPDEISLEQLDESVQVKKFRNLLNKGK